MSKKTEAKACQRNPDTLDNRTGELTSAFLIHCHLWWHPSIFYQIICGLFCIAHGCYACGILSRKRGKFASHFAMRYRLVRTLNYWPFLLELSAQHLLWVKWWLLLCSSCHTEINAWLASLPVKNMAHVCRPSHWYDICIRQLILLVSCARKSPAFIGGCLHSRVCAVSIVIAVNMATIVATLPHASLLQAFNQ